MEVQTFSSFNIAHLSTSDRIGVEIFEFVNSVIPEPKFAYWKTGVFHFSVQDPNIEGLAKRIIENGGKLRSQSESIIQKKNHIEWFIVKIPLVTL